MKLLPILLLAVSTVALGSSVETSVISLRVFDAMYVGGGVGRAVPKVLVYSPEGVCIGVLDHSAIGSLTSAVSASIAQNEKTCEIFRSEVFGATSPSASTGAGRATVELLVFDVDFCVACDALREEFDALAQSDVDYEFIMTKVKMPLTSAPDKSIGG